MTWSYPTHTFKCGACGTVVTAIWTIGDLRIVMDAHAKHCPGYPPPTRKEPDA